MEVRHADALKFDVRALFMKARVKVVGNLPYYLSSQLLLRFLKWPSPISLWMCMLQKEMANRLSASPRTKDYGALTLQVQLHYRIEYLRTISASVFLPRPDIDSAIIRIWPRGPDELPACDDELFAKLVRQGFSQRRKQLGKLLRDEVSNWQATAVYPWFRPTGASRRAVPRKMDRAHQLYPANLLAKPVGLIRNPSPSSTGRIASWAQPRGTKCMGITRPTERSTCSCFNQKGRSSCEAFSLERSAPRAWDLSAAGHVNAGEDYDVAAARELEEELEHSDPLVRVAKLEALPNAPARSSSASIKAGATALSN